MQTYDFIMLFVLAGLTIYGYAKGMAWQLAYLTSFIASYFVAVKFSDRLAPLFGDAAPWNKFVAMAAIYAGFSLIIWMVFRVVRNGIDKVKLESFDRQMGAIIGAARGVLWCVGITFFAVTLLPDTVKQQIIGSQSGRYIARLLDKADAIVPPEIHEVIGPHLDRLNQELNQGVAPGFALGFPQQAPGNGGGQGAWPSFGGQQNSFGGQQQGAAGQNWPALPQGGQQQSGWLNNRQPAGTPAQPAGWPNNQTPANPWPRQ